jgi:D-alanyl-D-alanine carboxypeptidase
MKVFAWSFMGLLACLSIGFVTLRPGAFDWRDARDDGRVKGVSATVEEGVSFGSSSVSFESREQAAQVLPYKKPRIGDLYVSNAHASVVMDVDSGLVLHEYASHDQRQVASLTKLMTATIVMERIKNLDEAVTISEEAVSVEGTRVGCPRTGFCNGNRLIPGERVTVRDLLKAALMNSANDAAVALGMHIGGTQDGFAAIMNQRAKELGLKNTHFCTPSGLEPDGREKECYSTAHDIARMTAHSLRYDVLWDIMRLPETTIASVDLIRTHDIFNTDTLLDQYPNLLGTKTGFTPLAGYSLLAVAADPTSRHRVISVVLNDPERWSDIQAMFRWSFDSFIWK